jgi:hypothetical protein
MEVDGSCHCGKITYRAVVDPGKSSICHCTDCQTLTGSPYRASVPGPAASFKLLTGQPKIYIKTGESGTQRAHGFCPDCGAPIFARAVTDPQQYMLRIGGLRQRAALAPKRQIWCRSAVPWSASLAGLPKLEKQ